MHIILLGAIGETRQTLHHRVVGIKIPKKEAEWRIRNALLKVPGVEEAEVDLNAGQARVTGGHPEIKALVEAVTEAGYAVLDAGA